MRVRLRQWENSLALCIPSAFAAELGLEAEGEMELTLSDGVLMMRSTAASVSALDELLAAVTPENCHAEVESGSAVGAEIW